MKTPKQMNINTLISQQQAKSGQQSQEDSKKENSKAIEALWQMMGSMFGHKWISSFGAEVDPDKVWQATLRGVTPEQIKQGLAKLSASGNQWPPSAPEFRELCLTGGEHWEHRAMAHRIRETNEMLALPKPPRNKEVGKKHLENLKQSLTKRQQP